MTEISPQELKARLDRHESLVLLDVREDWETALCRLANATHIPIEEIEFRPISSASRASRRSTCRAASTSGRAPSIPA